MSEYGGPKIAVIGTGAMGHDIAQLCAQEVDKAGKAGKLLCRGKTLDVADFSQAGQGGQDVYSRYT